MATCTYSVHTCGPWDLLLSLSYSSVSFIILINWILAVKIITTKSRYTKSKFWNRIPQKTRNECQSVYTVKGLWTWSWVIFIITTLSVLIMVASVLITIAADDDGGQISFQSYAGIRWTIAMLTFYAALIGNWIFWPFIKKKRIVQKNEL